MPYGNSIFVLEVFVCLCFGFVVVLGLLLLLLLLFVLFGTTGISIVASVVPESAMKASGEVINTLTQL